MFLMLLCLFWLGPHVPPASLRLHEGCLDLALLHPTATQLGPINIFPLCTLHCSAHSARVALLVRVLTPVPFESLTHVVVTRQCLLPLVHETETCSAFCFLCVARLQARQRSCPCTVAVKLRQPCDTFWNVLHLCVGYF